MKLRALSALLPLVPLAALVTFNACSSDPEGTTDGGVSEVDSSIPGDPDGSTPTADGATGDSSNPPIPDGAPLPDGAPDPNPLAGVTVADHLTINEMQQMGANYIDGMMWGDGALFFTDPFAEGATGHIWRLPRVGNAPATVRPSGKAVGLCFDAANGGSMVVTETGPSAIARRKPDGTTREEIVSMVNALRFNSPNDCVVVANKGTYITDPNYLGDTQAKERVYRLSGAPVTVVAIAEYDKGKHPNGIATNADGSALFVSITGDNEIVKIALAADGAVVGAPVLFAKTGAEPDGIAVDTEGNVFVATKAGIESYSSAGTKWGTLPLAGNQQAQSITFGDAQGKTLFIGSMANRTGTPVIYKMAMRIAGVP